MEPQPTRYELVSRRALLKASAALGVAAVLPTACGNGDVDVFAGALTDPVTSGDPATPTPVATTAPVTPPPTAPTPPAEIAVPQPTVEPTAPAAPTAAPQFAVNGEMVITFTYTQGATGKNERPYVAVWIENEPGELVATVALWYQQRRRGERWLDHLNRWYQVDQESVTGGAASGTTVSSATREPGSYAVVWDGNIDGVPAIPAPYFVCIEAVREDGPYSLIREPLDLVGTVFETALPNDGELTAATVRIDV